jgi:multidrug resistance efflux pump
MDRPRRPDPAAPPARGPAGRTPSEEQALWDAFAVAATPEAFYRTWLAIQCRMVPGVGSAVIVAGPPGIGPFSPAAFWPERPRGVTHLAEAAERALAERRGQIILRQVPGEAGAPAGERYDVAYPIQGQGKIYGVVALDLTSRPEAELLAVMRQLQWGSAWLELMVDRRETGDAGLAKERLQAVLDLMGTVLAAPSAGGALTAFATALSTRLHCERVSVGFVSRGRARVRAVSHAAHFGRQSNVVRAIGMAMDEAIDQQATVVYPEPKGVPARIVRAHEELTAQHGSGAVCTIPLAEVERAVGALTLERPADRPFDGEAIALCEALAAAVGPVLEMRRRDDRWLVTKAADSLRHWLGRLIGPRHVGLKVATAAVLAAIAFLVYAEGDYRVSARMVMEASTRRAAVAPFNGYLREAPVRAGDVIEKGRVLAVLDDRELRLERSRWASQQEQFSRQRDQALAARNAAGIGIAAAQIQQAQAQMSLIDDQLRRTRVLAEFDGVVVTGDLSQSLGSPVERGQVLFEVAPLEAYRVVLQVDERDIADVTVGGHGHLLLSASPADPIPFTVAKITPVSTARDGRNYFRVEARLDETSSARLRPGLEGVGKIEVGRRSLAWIWLRPVIDWARLTLWTWLP